MSVFGRNAESWDDISELFGKKIIGISPWLFYQDMPILSREKYKLLKTT
jgi:hypothetical protein